jgi:osmoprotectant transport system permease protein
VIHASIFDATVQSRGKADWEGNRLILLQQVLQFIQNAQPPFGQETLLTLEYAIIPTVVCILIAIPLGVLVAPSPVAAFLASNASGLARAIPTIAFLAAALPLLGIGFTPTVVALTVLGVPPILLNTVAGLRGIDPSTIEAGRGMGMTSWQLLRRIRIPLVLPLIAAGVRTSAVQIVATVPIAGLIGGGGYGDYILFGINLLQRVPLFVGAGGIVILALLAEVGLGAVQRAVTPAGLRIREHVETPTPRGAGDEPVAA